MSTVLAGLQLAACHRMRSKRRVMIACVVALFAVRWGVVNGGAEPASRASFVRLWGARNGPADCALASKGQLHDYRACYSFDWVSVRWAGVFADDPCVALTRAARNTLCAYRQ